MSVRGHGRGIAIAGAAMALLAGALALWLSAAAPSGAASAQQHQGTAVTVADRTISWGSAADCVQSMGTADFGSALPGATAQSAAFKGCVTSNSDGWSVSASATDLGADLDGDGTIGENGGEGIISKENLFIRTNGTSGSAAGFPTPCQPELIPEGCSLASDATLLSGASAGTGGVNYDYELAVPATAAAGVYGGTVTYTASN